ALASNAERYGKDVSAPGADGAWSDALARVRRKMADVAGKSSRSGLVLMLDLRRLYLPGQEDLLDWIMVGQAAKARRDKELSSLAELGTLRPNAS
ncbi:MAG TPA: hypothetical protein VF190_00545, partial [Rhodothermales bacterium]